MLIVGTEWLVDAAGCNVEALRDVTTLRAVVSRVVAELNLHVVKEPLWHQFPPPGGVTGLVLLSESHLACHTYPEFGVATINLYCCRTRPQWPWNERLGEMLGASNVTVRVVERRPQAMPHQADAHSANGNVEMCEPLSTERKRPTSEATPIDKLAPAWSARGSEQR